MESPRGIQDPSLGALGEVLAAVDLLVLVGKPIDFTLRFGAPPAFSPTCGVIVLDPDLSQVSRAARTQGERFFFGELIASASSALKGLCDGATDRATGDPSNWAAFVADALAYRMAEWSSARATEPSRLHPVELCRAVQDFIERRPETTLVCDGGEIGQWPQALVRTDRRLINGVAGTIGVSLPFALAAKAHRPDHPVLAVMGDGTFGFHMAELDTALRHDLPVIVVIGNDARWNAEYQIQLRSYGPERAKHCDLLPTRYDQLAQALGGFGALVQSEHELADALREAHASRRPAVINVMMESVPAPVVRRPS
jgi:acetolactate synthase-1/2/3 large subunit